MQMMKGLWPDNDDRASTQQMLIATNFAERYRESAQVVAVWDPFTAPHIFAPSLA